MGHDGQGNAMTEIALALAMAFFSIMVLTMVSMGASSGKKLSLPLLALQPVAQGAHSASIRAVSPDDLIIYRGGRFYDAQLQTVNPNTLPKDAPVVLAFEAAVSLSEAVAVRGRLNHPDLTVTTLDERWLAALQEKVQ